MVFWQTNGRLIPSSQLKGNFCKDVPVFIAGNAYGRHNSTQRLQQHIAYIPRGLGYSPCYHAVCEQQKSVEYEKIDLGSSGDALQTEGPMTDPRTAGHRKCGAILSELKACRRRLEITSRPEDPQAVSEAIGHRLSQARMQWIHQYYTQGPDALSDNTLLMLGFRCFVIVLSELMCGPLVRDGFPRMGQTLDAGLDCVS